MNPQGPPNWLGSSGMPPLGFGMMMPQPSYNGNSAPGINNPSNHSIRNKMPVENSMNIESLINQNLSYQNMIPPQQTQNYHDVHIKQQQQKQWIAKQQKLKKQKQFDEQKQRFRDIDTKKSKNSFSADAMIQNILTKEESSWQNTNQPTFQPINLSSSEKTKMTPVYSPPQQGMFAPPKQPYHYTSEANQMTSVNPEKQPPLSSAVPPQHLKKKSFALPKWLTEASEIPELYKTACGLVEDKDDWVDTKRAYMLLMQTNIPPQFLGVVWDMVNRTQPGQLKTAEFRELLALVALLQKGLTFTDAEILSSQVEPIYPLIDHPVLLPLVEEKKQGTPVVAAVEDDDFDDFVSAAPPPPPPQQNQSSPPLQSKVVVPHFPLISQPEESKPSFPVIQPPSQPIIPQIQQPPTSKKTPSEAERSLNFPQLGNSPLNCPKATKVVAEPQDDFADFQSAPATQLSAPPPQNTSKSDNDKYAALREFSTEPIATDATPETKIVNEPHNNDWAKDCFGEFESNQKVAMFPTDFSSDSSQYVTASASAATSSDDDFGDFIGPSSTLPPIPLLAETGSVNSLELPGLDLTVNLGSCNKEETKTEIPALSDALFDQEFQNLSLAPQNTELAHGIGDLVLPAAPVPIGDKYSLIREEEDKTSSHVEPWKKCLQGCQKLLTEALDTLKGIHSSSLLQEVLATSQMQDYLANLCQVNGVRKRIKTSSHNLPVPPEIKNLLLELNYLWSSIVEITGQVTEPPNNDFSCDAAVCSLCLLSGGVYLSYGSSSYHAPCANLWLNAVDLTLPTLKKALL